MNKEEIIDSVKNAYDNLLGIILRTPLLHSKWLTAETGCNVYLKLESEQITGSFKIRGATNAIKNLVGKDVSKKPAQLVTASAGNHALSCAFVSSKMEIKLAIYATADISKAKVDKLKYYQNASLDINSKDMGEAHSKALLMAKENNLPFISSYNNWDVIFGQATIAVELLEQLPNVDGILVPIGGGGLISGIALYIKAYKPDIKIIGLQSANNSFMYDSVKAGKVLDEYKHKDTIALGGPVMKGCITFDICAKYIDEWILPEEEEIEKAVVDMLIYESKVIEGAAGLLIAGLRKVKKDYQNKNLALVLCGSNIGIDILKHLINKHA